MLYICVCVCVCTVAQCHAELHTAAAAAPCRPAGAHAVTLSWLPLLSDFLGGAGGDEPPGPLPAVLPAPAVEELLLSKAGAVGACCAGGAAWLGAWAGGMLRV